MNIRLYLQATFTSFAFICVGFTSVSYAEEADVHFAGEHQGAGPISFAPNAQPLQLTWSGNVALRLQTQTAEERVEDLLWDMNVFLRAEASTEAKRSSWIFFGITPLSSQVPLPGPATGDGHAITQLGTLTHWVNKNGFLQLRAGLLNQYVGRKDTLFWTTLRPIRVGARGLRLYARSLGLSLDKKFGDWQLGFDLGQPIEDIGNPFETKEGVQTQLRLTRWLGNARIWSDASFRNHGDDQVAEVNGGWAIPLQTIGLNLPVTLIGELGVVTDTELHPQMVGALYANHEVNIALPYVELKLRYDWTDDDTEYQFDTQHLLRSALVINPARYTQLQAIYTHAWTHYEERFETSGNDEILVVLRVLY